MVTNTVCISGKLDRNYFTCCGENLIFEFDIKASLEIMAFPEKKRKTKKMEKRKKKKTTTKCL